MRRPATTPSTLRQELERSALARPLDFTVPSNRVAVLGAVSATLLARLTGKSWREASGVGGAGFLAWATARELDPDHPETANAALPVSVLAALVGGSPDLPAALSVLSGLRILAGTVGFPPTLPDVAALTGQVALAARRGERVPALLPAAALGLSSTRVDGLQGTEGAAALAGGVALLPGARSGQGSSMPADLLVLVALGLTGVLTAPEAVHSRCDRTSRTVLEERVRLSRLLAAGTLGLGLLGRQTRTLVPLAAAVLTVAGRRVSGRGGVTVSPPTVPGAGASYAQA